MSGAVRPEDAFQLELDGTSVQDGASGLMETVALLHAIGSEIQAPTSLGARRGALLAAGHASGASMGSGGGWRRARATLLAAALTMLMVVGVGAATVGSRWLSESDSDEPPDVRMVQPEREALDELDLDSPAPSPSLAGSQPDDAASEVDASDSTEPGESDSSEPDDGDSFEADASDSAEADENGWSEADASDSAEPGESDSFDDDDVIEPDGVSEPDESDPAERGEDATTPDDAQDD